MKNLNKIILLVVLFSIAGLLVTLLSGCNTVHYTQTMPDGTKNEVYSSRFIWSTDSYKATLPNGASLEATKSNPDAATITAVSALVQSLKPAP